MIWDFKKGRLSGELAPKPGQPESIENHRNVNNVWAIFYEIQRMSCVEIAVSTNISKTSMFRILHNNLQLSHGCFTWVLHYLTKMQIRIHLCHEKKQMLKNNSNFLKTIIKCDKTSVYHFHPLSKHATSVWKYIEIVRF